jgi:hypothetical protein
LLPPSAQAQFASITTQKTSFPPLEALFEVDGNVYSVLLSIAGTIHIPKFKLCFRSLPAILSSSVIATIAKLFILVSTPCMYFIDCMNLSVVFFSFVLS